jgi:hypothetical protein
VDTQDTLVEKKTVNENSSKKKKSITEWTKPKRSPTAKEQGKLFGKSLGSNAHYLYGQPHVPV